VRPEVVFVGESDNLRGVRSLPPRRPAHEDALTAFDRLELLGNGQAGLEHPVAHTLPGADAHRAIVQPLSVSLDCRLGGAVHVREHEKVGAARHLDQCALHGLDPRVGVEVIGERTIIEKVRRVVWRHLRGRPPVAVRM